MDPSWIEFQAEFEYIRIEPKFTAPVIDLLQCDVGPFKAGIPLTVPLWLGVSFRQRQKCRIIPPEWMTVDNLEEAKESEKQTQYFTELPDPFLFVKAQLIMDVGNEDIPRVDEVRTTIKDIWDIRQSKLRKIVDSFVQSGALRATLNNVQTIEMNSVRPLLTHALDQIHRLDMATHTAERASQNSQNTMSMDRSSFSHSFR